MGEKTNGYSNGIHIPATYKAVVYDQPGTLSTKVVTLDTPEPGAGEVLINLTHSGVCHSDYSIMTNGWQKTFNRPTKAGQVGGHEGVGFVVKLGPGTENSNIEIGDRVGVKWLSYACQNCEACLAGHDAACFNQKISGFETPGTFQQYVLGPALYVTKIPKGLDSAMAAPMLCAGITTYAALRKSNAQSGDYVVISGSGGGLGHLAVQIACTMGYRVIGIDADEKKDITLENGAETFIPLSLGTDGVQDAVKNASSGLGAHAVIICTAANAAYAQGMHLLRFGGRLVVVGMPEGDPQPIGSALPQQMIVKESSVVGSAVGDRKDAVECLKLAARGLVKTHFRVEKMDKLNEVFQEMEDGKLQGRVVLDLS